MNEDEFSNGEINDDRLVSFMRTSVICVLVLLVNNPEVPYDECVDRIFSDMLLDYLAAHGQELPAFGYDDAYGNFSYAAELQGLKN